MHATADDHEVIARSLSEPEAFRALFDRHFAAIHRFLLRRCGTTASADDLAAETFVRAFAARERYVAQGDDARPWLYAIAANLARDEARRAHRGAGALRRLGVPRGVEDPDVAAGGLDDALTDAVGALRPDEREALLLHAWGELSYAEIAAAQGVEVGTVRSRLHRARTRVRKSLAAAAALAVLAALVVALWPGRAAKTPVVATASAAERACLRAPAGSPAAPCLQALAPLAGAQDVLAAGRVWYQRNRWTHAATRFGPDRGQSAARWRTLPRARRVFEVIRETTEEWWIAPDGSGRIAYGRDGAWHPASVQDARAWRAAGAPDLDRLLGTAQGTTDARTMSFNKPGGMEEALLSASTADAVLPARDRLSVLPTDPDALSRWLDAAVIRQRQTNCGHASQAECASMLTDTRVDDIIMFLRWPTAAPALRRALLTVLGRTPGASVAGGAIRDLAGRRVATILLPPTAGPRLVRQVVAFDPKTARLDADGYQQDGAIRWNATYAVRTAAVAKVGERP